MKIKLDDILEAFELNNRYSEYFLDLETCEVVQVNDMMAQEEKDEIYDHLDEHGFLRLPSSFDIGDFDLMGNFIDTLDGSPRKKLQSSITNRHPFSSFKDEIRRMGLDNQWYEFQSSAYRQMAIEWCEEHDLEWME